MKSNQSLQVAQIKHATLEQYHVICREIQLIHSCLHFMDLNNIEYTHLKRTYVKAKLKAHVTFSFKLEASSTWSPINHYETPQWNVKITSWEVDFPVCRNLLVWIHFCVNHLKHNTVFHIYRNDHLNRIHNNRI